MLSKLLKWISEVEGRISSQSVVRESEEELRNQINTMKQVKDDLDQHASQVSHCGDQVRQLVLTGGDVLSKSEVSALEKSGRNLKLRYDKSVDRAERLLKKLFAARDELFKLKGELSNFSTWLNKARRVLEEKERSLSDLHKLDSSTDSTKEFVSDVIAHQADLRFITMAAQKFFDESKEYLNVLNEFRTSLPSRLPHIEPLSSQDSPIRNEVSYVTQQYRDLLHRANNLSDRLSGVGSRQRDYTDALDKARQWLRDVEPKVNKVLNEPIAGDPKGVEDQLNKAKTLNNEFIANGRLIDNIKQALDSLLRSLEGQLSPVEMSRLEQPVIELDQKYKQLGNALAERCQELDTALVQSQGVQDALDGIVNWLNSAENQFKNLQRPASLIKDRLEEQLREHRVFQSDIDTHISSIDSVYLSASELIVSTSNARVAKQIETKLNDVKVRFEKLFDRTQKRAEFLEDVNSNLSVFLTHSTQFEQWYSGIVELLDSRDFAKLSIQEYTTRMSDIAANRDGKRELFDSTIRDGKDLVNKRDVTDTAPVRDRIKAMENQWKELNSLLDEKHKLSLQRAEQLNIYEGLRLQVSEWLTKMETRMTRLEIVALDMETLRLQNDELKPIAKEYRDYAVTIDKVNDVGNSYDNLVKSERPDSPTKKRTQAYSPTKRTTIAVSPLRRGSQDGRSPSPTKGISMQSPISPGGSSGFSSRRSSQDGFHLEELSPIQQQLSEINNRYSLLGIKISDRQSEIDSTRDEVKKHLDNLKILDSFLDKVQRQLPKEIVPNTKEEADKSVKQIRQIMEELYEKQSLLDSTRTQVKDLLRRKPGALGADNLNDELEDVVSRWKSLNDRCKDRIKFMEDMKEFLDTHESMSSWLSAKERMLTVLGPISSDSRMVQSQVQQVQVLREEFRTQQPQLQHLIDVGDSVLSYLDPRSPDGQKVNTKLTNVQQRWSDLLGKLDERADSLGAAVDTSREFDAQHTRLREALQTISDNLDELPLDRDPEEQLRKIENFERQLEGQRPLLADLEAAGIQLCNVLSDPASRTDIQAKLASIGRQYNALQKKLDHRKAEIEGSLRDGRMFEASCAKTLGWLSEELGSLSERLLISADRDVLEQQLAHHEPIYREVLAREHEVIMLLNKGRDMISRNSKSDSRTLQRDVDKIQQQWDKLRKETMDRQTRLQTCMEHCRKYYRTLETFLPWLRQAEDKLDSLKPSSFKRKHIEKQLKDLQVFRNEVWKRSGEYENTRSLGDTFHSACDIDKDIVKNELNNLKDRWDKLNNDVIARTQALEDQSRKLSDFNENLRELLHGLERCEDKLASHDALGGVARDPKLLDRVKSLRDEVAQLKRPHQTVRQQATDLVREAAENSIDANHLEDEVDGLGDRINELHAKLDDRCSDLQSAATAVMQFNDQVKALTNDLSGLETELDSMKPPGREFKTVKLQIDDIGNLIGKINKASDDVNDAVFAGERLVDSGFAPDTVQTRQQVDSLRKQLGKLDERARNREQNLEGTLKKLQDFYLNHSSVLDNIGDTTEQLRKMKPVASEVDSIRAQQQDFKKFRAKSVEPLSKMVDDCNRIGQSLIQSASPGVNTTTLEKDLEKMNDLWNSLKEKINDRERRLDIALLQSGKFQEALDGLAKWLTDTEELVANQKAPSADYKVVKAQLQEQKFLKKMLLDRQHSMSSLFSMGNEIAKEAEPKERKAIEKQLKDLIGRFDALTEGAQQRTLDLERAMHVAKQFQDKLVPLQDWLDRSERKVKDMELIPTDEEKIQIRIREHDILHNDILDKKPDFSELTDIASNLMALVGDDEASGLADKLQEVTDRYGNLVEASEHVGQLLTSSRQGLRHLVLTYQDLAGWMDDMEQQLSRYKILAVHTDRLLEQMDDLANLTENISSRQQDVDGTVDAGVELMRHISSDEALQLKDKLDSLQRRYNELTSRGADLLKNAQDLLPLVQQFHNNHNCLGEWMKTAESVLQSADTNENEIARLELDLQEQRPILEAINLLGPQLCQASAGEGAATIEGLVTRDNRRFDAISEQIQRRAERIHLGKQRALEVTGDIDELLEWFREVESQIRDAEKPSAEPDLIRVQLKEHKALNDDISSQKGRVRDVLATSRKVLRESPPSDDTSLIREKMEDLRETMDTVSALSSDRLGILEQALPLAEHFHDTHAVLSNWLSDMEEQVSMLAMPAMRPDLIAQQQDRNELFVQSINEHKPLVDKLNKTGEALVKLCNDDDGSKVQELLDSCNERYSALKLELRERQQALERALQESSKFADKLEGMLRALTNTADQVHNQEPISAHPPKIRDQIEDNNALISDLDKRKEAYAAVQRAADDVINKAGNRADPAIKDVKRKLDKLKNLWDDVQKATNDRGLSLEDALDAAQKFWSELHAVMVTLRDLEDSLTSQEPPAVEPKTIQQQQVALQEIRHEIDQTKPDVDQVRASGQELMQLCGEPDKPEVKKHIEDLDHAWDNITALYAKREENLIDAMEKAMEFHETLQNLMVFLNEAEKKFVKMGPLGTDIDAVKRQIEQLKQFKSEVDPHMVKVEALNRSLIRQAQELTERTSADQAAAIKEPLAAVNRRWDDLLRGVVDRQRQLENALLRLGQFQHALNELLVWISKTDQTLDELKPVAGDPQILEIELAKLKVLVNDIQAHQTSIDTLNDAGRQIIESGKGTDEACVTQDKLNVLNTAWRALMQKAADRQRELEIALREAQQFNAEIQDLLSWLGDVDGIIAASKPVGGLPETASEQLERFMEVYNEIEENRPKVETVLAQGQEYLRKGSNAASNLQHNLRTLKQRWDSVTSRANDKKIKLEIALKEATEFHDALQSFVDWLTNAEKVLSNLKPVSRVLETVQAQIEDHKVFQKDVSAHRETMLNLDKKGTHLKYFSQKQDVILIKNLLISVQHRWERVASKSAERTRALDLGYKEAREFHDSWSGLMSWLEDTESSLDEVMRDAIVNDPEKIKQRLAKHQEFQRALSSKQSSYDNTMKVGKHLKEKAPKIDETVLKQMLVELKNRWTSVCNKSVDIQRKLEEALLYSGQFKDAIAALLQWLQKAEKDLSSEDPLYGDLDTVHHLIDQHHHFEQELEARNAQMETVMRTGHELEVKGNKADAATIRTQLNELNAIWEVVSRLTHRKSARLEEALKEAERLHKAVHMLLDWLSDAEMKLRFAGNTPEDEESAYAQLEVLEKIRRELHDKEVEKDNTLTLAHNVLAKAHPDAVNVIKHWITIIQSRWEEVSQWAQQRYKKLSSHIQSLRDMDDSLEELLAWLQGLENTLLSLRQEELPMDIPSTEQLIADHKEFMENTQKRQVEVDRICKAKQVKQSATKESRKIPKSKTPIRTSPGREISPDPNIPHIGPRFPPAGSTEPEFRSPRVKYLWDKWRNVWMLEWERQRVLYDHLAYLKEKERADNFSWDDWRRRFLKFMNHKKSRLTDLFRKMDKDNNGLIPRDEFIDGIIRTKFDTSRLEMKAVADMFDRNNCGLIDWKEFIAALRPDWQEKAPDIDAQKIHDEVKRLVMLCTCRLKFKVFQVGEGKYRFGDSQKLRLVRILRSTVMVRVGGGWVALDEFLLKNDPCRAKGRTNIELREQFILADGVSQSMTAFKPKTSASTPGSGSSANSLRTPTAGPITKVRERSVRSTPMSSGGPTRASKSSLGTPESLSDTEGPSLRTPRKPSYRSTLTPGGSRPSSRPASRTGSRPSSKPPSRHGSNLSLDSTDDGTPSRIPTRRTPMSGRNTLTVTTTTPRKTTPLNGLSSSRPRTPTGLLTPTSPAGKSSGIPRASSIPTLLNTAVSRSRIPVYVGPDEGDTELESPSTTSSCSYSFSSGSKSLGSKSRIPVSNRTFKTPATPSNAPTLRTAMRTRTPSGSNTPVPSGTQTASSRLVRKPSGASDTTKPQTKRATTPKEPFRL
ncbi:dystonin isoform X4 [Photinus pyralis]|uniref:dystonin isoform X4 n=1 Tax=Photinus pyralis TaxID=7054 RepID=UPI0012671D65|nr:dystonin isoform X4 [Photinus pyralis]